MTVVDTSERVFPRHRLANGLQIVAQPMEGVESASLGYLISAGARNEQPSEAGISHFVEALGFQGTANRSVQELTQALEDIGAHPESGTETEFTSYSTTLLGRNLAAALELLTDVVLHPGFVPEEIPKARDRILQEIAQREDERGDVVDHVLGGGGAEGPVRLGELLLLRAPPGRREAEIR